MAANPVHTAGFLKFVNEARQRIREIPAAALADEMRKHSNAALIDVREESEYAAGHVRGAEHIGKGVIERDIETRHPDPDQPLFLYCGGGFRSALASDSLVKMGYRKVFSVDGGWRALQSLMPTET